MNRLSSPDHSPSAPAQVHEELVLRAVTARMMRPGREFFRRQHMGQLSLLPPERGMMPDGVRSITEAPGFQEHKHATAPDRGVEGEVYDMEKYRRIQAAEAAVEAALRPPGELPSQ